MYTRNTHHIVLMKVIKYRQLNMIINLLHVLNNFKVNKNWRYIGSSCLHWTIFLYFTDILFLCVPSFQWSWKCSFLKKKLKKIIIVGLELLVSTYCSFLYFVFLWKLKKIKLYKILSSIPSNKSTVLHYNQFKLELHI